MTARLNRLAKAEADEQADRRKEPRHSTWAVARLESARGDSTEAILADVSSHGCAVKSDSEWLRVGGFVSISLDDEPQLQAIVRWMRDGNAGMEFLRPIPHTRTEWHDLMNGRFRA